MAPTSRDQDAFPGVDDSVYKTNQTFNTFDNHYAFPTDHYANNNAGWGLNAGNLHETQTVSRGPSQSAAWLAQQHQHLSSRSLSSGPPHDALRHSPAPPPAYNAYQAPSPYPYHHQQQQQQHQQYDPSLLSTPNQPLHQPFPTYHDPTTESHTIAPQSLQHETSAFADKNSTVLSTYSTYNTPAAAAGLVDQNVLVSAIPKSDQAGLFALIDFDKLVRATNSERIGNYANVGRIAQEWAINRAALPSYVPRSSRNALKRAAGNDPSLLAKISGSRKSKSKLHASRPTVWKADPTGKSAVKGESVSVASDDSSDESDSDHTSDEEIEDAPLPSKRPDSLREAIEYDTIEALWRSKRRAVDANDVRKALVAFWEIVKTVRDRWKADTAAVTQAEEKGAKGELPFLRQRVKDQRDLIEIAFKTALKHGNRTILETLSENTSLIFLCYQFLLDRHKADDINGSLARAILEVMAQFTTLNKEKLEKTHLVKVLPRIIKSGDAKTQFYAKQITNKAASVQVSASKPIDEKTPATVAAPSVRTDATAGVKRPGGALTGASAGKKPAISTIKTAETTMSTAKKRLLGDDAAKPATKKVATTNGTLQAKTDATTAKPASKLKSGLFAGLQSAQKKPGTAVKSGVSASSSRDTVPKPSAATLAPERPTFSLADAMKSIANPKEDKPVPKEEVKQVIKETPEEKARRLRREARGPLRVHWKTGEDLVAVREFTHDPDEDMGHDSSQTRDVADLKGEGRMFKQQHNMMDLDEDDDDALGPAKEVKTVEWFEPNAVDFSDVDAEERKRNYSRFAGGHLDPTSLENAEREKYEANTLLVFYSQPEDIPPNPREPAQAISGDAQAHITMFGAPGQKVIDRARQTRSMQQQIANALPSGDTLQAPIDFDKLRNVLSQAKVTSQPVQPPSSTPDIMSILAKISQGNVVQPPQPPMPFTAPNQAWAGILPSASSQPPPSAQPDISAILASLKGTQQPPAMSAPPPPFPSFNGPALDPGFLAFVAQQQAAAQAQQASQQSTGIYENPDRKRWRDGDDLAAGADGDGSHNAYKTKVCKYYQEGKCLKGDQCTYIHE